MFQAPTLQKLDKYNLRKMLKKHVKATGLNIILHNLELDEHDINSLYLDVAPATHIAWVVELQNIQTKTVKKNFQMECLMECSIQSCLKET